MAQSDDVASTGETDREVIGTVLSKPVYRDQIRDTNPLRGELHQLFAAPVLQKYQDEHRKDIAPTPDELETLTSYLSRTIRTRLEGEYGDLLRKQLADVVTKMQAADLPAEDRKKLELEKQAYEGILNPTMKQHAFTAKWMLSRWKFQRFLYDQYGGGRIVWQQAGVEAFDAMHKWYRAREAAGDFTITDADLKAEFYAYWTNEKMHGAFLTGDKERIRSSFLEPPWLVKLDPAEE